MFDESTGRQPSRRKIGEDSIKCAMSNAANAPTAGSKGHRFI
jgi:hypothetical protein